MNIINKNTLISYIKEVFQNELKDVFIYNNTTKNLQYHYKKDINVNFVEFNILIYDILPIDLINIIQEYGTFCLKINSVELSKYDSLSYKSICCNISCTIFDFIYDFYITLDSNKDIFCYIHELQHDDTIYKTSANTNNIIYFLNDFVRKYYDLNNDFPTKSPTYCKNKYWNNNTWLFVYRMQLYNDIDSVVVNNQELTKSIIDILKIIFNIFSEEMTIKYKLKIE